MVIQAPDHVCVSPVSCSQRMEANIAQIYLGLVTAALEQSMTNIYISLIIQNFGYFVWEKFQTLPFKTNICFLEVLFCTF